MNVHLVVRRDGDICKAIIRRDVDNHILAKRQVKDNQEAALWFRKMLLDPTWEKEDGYPSVDVVCE